MSTSNSIPDARDLALLVIHTLDAQGQYARTRSLADLGPCKNLEDKLRAMAAQVINGVAQPGLFDDGSES